MQNAYRIQIICILLAAITIAVFSPVTHFAFLNCDDQTYVVDNTAIHDGITGTGMVWALTTHYASNWHPVTWLSHMLDCDLFGSSPAGHHFTNVMLHLANSELVFLVLLQLTGATWRCALVAALFAWHPLHIESVAWVAERKDVLSTFFALLAVWAYALYGRKSRVEGPPQKAKSKKQKSIRYYILSVALFALALMSKPMAVTLPCVMLLLDVWPLERVSIAKPSGFASWSPLLVEKIPYFILAAFDCVATIWAQKSANSVVSLQDVPFSLRVCNAFVSYTRYLGKLVWPDHLAVFYPYPDVWNLWEVASSVALLVVLSAVAVALARRFPFLLIGWLWFLGMLVPVIGLAQVGTQAMADRYAYMPSIGFFIMVVWGLSILCKKLPQVQTIAGLLAVGWLAVLVVCTRAQLKYWRDSAALFRHALAVTPDNIFAEYNLGQALDTQGRKEEAAVYYARALALRPRRIETTQNSQYVAHFNWGIILANQQHLLAEAESHFRAALSAKPDFWGAHDCLGKVLMAAGRTDEAIEEFQAVVRLAPNRREGWQQLGDGLERQGKSDEAARARAEAQRLTPGIQVR